MCNGKINVLIATATQIAGRFREFENEIVPAQAKLAASLKALQTLEDYDTRFLTLSKMWPPGSAFEAIFYNIYNVTYTADHKVDEDVQAIIFHWAPALEAVQSLIGGFDAIKNDLAAIEEFLDDEVIWAAKDFVEVVNSGFMLDMNKDIIISMWGEVATEAKSLATK